MRTYLVISKKAIDGSFHGYPGQIFLVAENDQAWGGYHARPISPMLQEIETEPAFQINYGNSQCPTTEDGGGFVFVPTFLVEVFTDAEEATHFSNSLQEEENDIEGT